MSTRKTTPKHLQVIELFAGVGGFRVGLDRSTSELGGQGFETIWANQWEPGSAKQHAARVYRQIFFHANGVTADETVKEYFVNDDINEVVGNPLSLAKIPDHDVLTGGFPCQDYSVARPANQAAGIEGKKGVLWWSIHKILAHKQKVGRPVNYVFLENVDRLLKSPTARRGRDFAIILTCLNNLGYYVEWRVINAGEYGFPQRRRRTFILGYHKDSPVGKQLARGRDAEKWLNEAGLFAKAFPVSGDEKILGSFELDPDPVAITKNFKPLKQKGDIDPTSPFQNGGVMMNGHVYTRKFRAAFTGERVTLGDIINATKTADIPDEFYVLPSEVRRWKLQKEAHDFMRTSKSGHEYRYTEGALPFPDKIDVPSRTIITSEGGRTPTRFKHVVKLKHPRTIDGKVCEYRRLTPEELEALCMFDRGHTETMCGMNGASEEPAPATKRAFFMGNALVVGVIQRIGMFLAIAHHSAQPTATNTTKMKAKAMVR